MLLEMSILVNVPDASRDTFSQTESALMRSMRNALMEEHITLVMKPAFGVNFHSLPRTTNALRPSTFQTNAEELEVTKTRSFASCVRMEFQKPVQENAFLCQMKKDMKTVNGESSAESKTTTVSCARKDTMKASEETMVRESTKAALSMTLKSH